MACIACGERCDYCDNPDQKGKPYYRIFICTYIDDFHKFVKYLEENGARPISCGMDLEDGGYIVTYKHTEELCIETKT